MAATGLHADELTASRVAVGVDTTAHLARRVGIDPDSVPARPVTRYSRRRFMGYGAAGAALAVTALGVTSPARASARGTRRATPPGTDSGGSERRTTWATRDPDQANALLDEIGLTDSDGSGMRPRPAGGGRIVLDYQSGPNFADFVGCGEMIKQDWTEIGIDVEVEQVERNLLTERAVANELMLSGHPVGTDDPFIKPDSFLPTNTSTFLGMIGIPYAQWFASQSAEGVEPPPSLQELEDAIELYDEGLQTVDEKRRNEIGKELYRMHRPGVVDRMRRLRHGDLRDVPGERPPAQCPRQGAQHAPSALAGQCPTDDLLRRIVL